MAESKQQQQLQPVLVPEHKISAPTAAITPLTPAESHFQVLSNTADEFEIILRNASELWAKTIRATVLADVPSTAIEAMIRFRNDSQVSGIISNRLLLWRMAVNVPIPSEHTERLTDFSTCECETRGCANCCVRFYINVSVPATAEEGTIRHVTSDDMEPVPSHLDVVLEEEWLKKQNRHHHHGKRHRNEESKFVWKRPADVRVTNGETYPITKIGPGQGVNFVAICVKGVGRRHNKWSPVHNVTQISPSIVTMNKSISLAVPETAHRQVVKTCPRKVFKLIPHPTKPHAVVADIEDASNCNKCLDCQTLSCVVGQPDWIRVSHDPTTARMRFSSKDTMPPMHAVRHSLHLLRNKIRTYTGQSRLPAFV